MASLRRPSAAIPGSKNQPQSVRVRPPLPENAIKRKDARRSKVGEKIRNRLSTRFVPGVRVVGISSSLSFRYADASPTVSTPPPMPFSISAPREMRKAYLEHDSYTPVSQPLDFEDDTIDDGVGESRFGQLALGTQEDERIVRRGAADMTLIDEWDLEDLSKEDVDVQSCKPNVRPVLNADLNES
jgi:hypothetical protein